MTPVLALMLKNGCDQFAHGGNAILFRAVVAFPEPGPSSAGHKGATATLPATLRRITLSLRRPWWLRAVSADLVELCLCSDVLEPGDDSRVGTREGGRFAPARPIA